MTFIPAKRTITLTVADVERLRGHYSVGERLEVEAVTLIAGDVRGDYLTFVLPDGERVHLADRP